MLIDKAEDEASRRAMIRRLSEVDWDFPARPSESAFSSLHWHPCRFPSQIPAITLARLTEPGDLILDPFMGSATTLVEAQRLARNSVGIDINPISCLIARAKTLSLSSDEIQRYVDRARLKITQNWEVLDAVDPPRSVQGPKWYTPHTFLGLRKIWGVLQRDDTVTAPIGLAAFSSILLSACRETRHWGYVCDNTAPKSNREADASALFLGALDRFARAYRKRDRFLESGLREAEVIQGDASTVLATFPHEHFACVVTSPPYLGVTDYVKAQRLSMEWMSIEIEPLRQNEIGARSKRHRRQSREFYIAELKAVFTQVHRVLRTGGLSIVVFGQSPARQDSHNDFVAALRDIGFSLELEKKRQISLTRRQTPSLVDETVLILRK